MDTNNDLSDSLSPVTNANPTREYYEELDYRKLNLQKPEVQKPAVKELPPEPPPIDPIKQLNEQLNRQFRPDLVPPSPSPTFPPSETIPKRIPIPNPVIFDARAKPVKPLKNKKEPSTSTTEKSNLVNQLIEPTTQPDPVSNFTMSNYHTVTEYQVPPGMMLVPVPQQQMHPKTIEPSQQLQVYPTVTQYKSSTVTQSNSFKHNKVAPPPTYKTQNVVHLNQSSMLSTTQPLPSFNPSQQHYAKESKNQYNENPSNAKNSNRAFALYNQQNGRIEGVVPNRLNVGNDDIDESRILDDQTESQSEFMTWLSQPLCLGLTRLSGIILFGSMGLLSCAAIAGLIASIVTYSQDNVNDAQWKILGMVVSAIMLITIIITLLIFICCYKHGYMFDKDDDADLINASGTRDADGNEQQKAFLRKIYKFNRPNETPPMRSTVSHYVKTPPPPQRSILVSDKQTNTNATIAELRPSDFDRGVWPSMNAYGGISYRPLILPHATSRLIQVFPHEIEEAMAPQHIVYQVVAPPAAVTTPPIHTRTIQIPGAQSSVVEVVETVQKGPRTLHVTGSQVPGVEIVETVQKVPRTIRVPAPETSTVEYVDATSKQLRTTVVRQPQTQQIMIQPNTRIEYVDIDEKRGHRIIQKPQYEIVEEVIDQSSASSMEEIVEIVEVPKHGRHREKKKKSKRHGIGRVSIKHIKPTHE